MAERDAERRSARVALLFGAGRRARTTGSVLAALSTLPAEENEKEPEPLAPQGVNDLEELLAQRSSDGLLILESTRVPGEDIGFVRRFLERRAGWRLVVLADDASDARLKSLLALPRAQWLAWPPDLDQLRSLLPHGTTERAPPPAARPAPGRKPAGRQPAGGGVDLGDLIEELLTGAALEGDGAPRYQYRCTEPVVVHRERSTLVEGFTGLLELARRCAGPDGLVSAAIDTGDDAVRIGIEFPQASLSEKDLPGLFDAAAAQRDDPTLAEGIAAARHGVEVLKEVGGRVELSPEPEGRVLCEVRLAPGAAPSTAVRRPGKPEDPFA
jgi:hypothetical protein